MARVKDENLYLKSLFDEFATEEEVQAQTQEMGKRDSDLREQAEKQIREKQRIVDYNIKDYPVEILVNKFTEGQENDENEFFIPYYQRDFTWDHRRKSRFIESLLLGLPVPPIFLAGVEKDIREDEGRLEIVDGSQRIRTLELFLNDQLTLGNLSKLDLLNGFSFSDLDISRQRKFKRHLIRVIELSDKADEETRRDLFERINTGSDNLHPIEVRRGAQSGPFFNFLDRMAGDPQFVEMVPVGTVKHSRKEEQELLLRFFAYSESYQDFKKNVDEFLTDFIAKVKDDDDIVERETRLRNVLRVVARFPHGFRKGGKFKTVPRVRFEAIAVGVALALEANPQLIEKELDVSEWISSDEFMSLTTTDGSNSAPRLRKRIEFVRDRLLRAE